MHRVIVDEAARAESVIDQLNPSSKKYGDCGWGEPSQFIIFDLLIYLFYFILFGQLRARNGIDSFQIIDCLLL